MYIGTDKERERERVTFLVYALLSINDFRFPHFLSNWASLLFVKHICFSTLKNPDSGNQDQEPKNVAFDQGL